MPTLNRQLRWYIVLRLVAVIAAVLPYGLVLLLASPAAVNPEETTPLEPPTAAASASEDQVGPPLPPAMAPKVPAATPPLIEPSALPPQVPLTLLGFTCGATLLYIALLRFLRNRPEVQAYIQFFGDLILVTGMVYYLGGIESPFSLLYLVVIAVASTLLRREAGLTVASTANVLYVGLILYLYNQGHGQSSVFRVSYNLAVHCVGFYAVALLTSYLARSARRAEQELEEKSEHLADLQVMHRDIVQSINSGLITTDLDGVVTLVNQAGLAILGRPEEELVGRPIQESGLFSSRQWGELTAASEQRGKLRSEVEFARNSETAFIGFSISQLTEANGGHGGYIVIFQDLTHWRRMREELRLKDRMAAVGEMAAGLAHEIGNPLAAISGSVQMLAGAPANEAAQRRLVEILLKESQRLDRTIKGFLRFAKPKDRSNVPFDIARLLAENFELLRNSEEVSPRHNLEIALDPPTARLLGDPDQVSQIFWNLARNALRAMPEGGTLRVVGSLGRDSYLFQVIDTGRGMSEEQRANLFHPFRSFFDGGTGIGMAIVYRIVQEHGGRLHVDSRPGGGTTIAVDLPRDEAAALRAATEPALLAASELP
ncbi:MAG TPA: ATP-binding protein [Thermoanaerobaculia bacterium]|nr:ATP-binding protein [Thermoanaerobaculia bacterium]